MPVPQVVTRIRELRAAGFGPAADDLLRARADGADPTDSALLIVLLQLEGQPAEANLAIAAAIQGTDQRTAAIAHGLLQLGATAACAALLAEAARRPPTRIGPLALELLAIGCAGPAAQFLAEAAAQAASQSALDTLVVELTAAGLAAQAWPAVWSVVKDWSADRLLALAEHFDSVGAEEIALHAYAQAGTVITENWPADRVARLIRRMTDSSSPATAQALLDAAVRTIGSFPSMIAYLATSLATSGLPGTARELLDRTAPELSDPELESLTSYLDAGRQKDLAVHAFGAAALARPAEAAIGYADTLRRHGQPAGADLLITRVLTARPMLAADMLKVLRAAGRQADAARLIDLLADRSPVICAAASRALWLAGADDDAARLFDALAAWPLADLAPVLAGLDRAGASGRTAAPEPLTDQLLARAPGEFAGAISALRARAKSHSADAESDSSQSADKEALAGAEHLLGLLRHGSPSLVVRTALDLADAGLVDDATGLLKQYGAAAAAEAAAGAFLLLEQAGRGGTDLISAAALTGRPDSAEFLAAIRRAGAWPAITRHLDQFAQTLSGTDLVTLCLSLDDQDAAADLDTLITGAARREDFDALRLTLHQAGRHALAYRLTERRAELTGSG